MRRYKKTQKLLDFLSEKKINKKIYDNSIVVSDWNALEIKRYTGSYGDAAYQLIPSLVKGKLKCVVTYPEKSGPYMLNPQHAIIGFQTIEQAQQFARQHGGEVSHLRRRETWRHFCRCEPAKMEFHLDETKISQPEAVFIRNEDDAHKFFQKKRDIQEISQEQINQMNQMLYKMALIPYQEQEPVVVASLEKDNDRLFFLHLSTMRYSFDSFDHEIGVTFNKLYL